ncbi:hypothetical protein [Bacillus manliponensis]|uniref:hypothetical protein n=1 Tax=Bacillus manliponensis TaxID=574376 RepID=UPI0035130E77
MKKVLLASVLGFSIFANATGVLANETDASWTKQSGQWYLSEKSGQKVTGWKKVDGTWYYFESDGVMVTGWKMIDGVWYS